MTDDLAHIISICAVVECPDRIMSVVGRTCAHEKNYSKPLPLNFTKTTTLIVTWNTDRDIKETEELILLGRSIQ